MNFRLRFTPTHLVIALISLAGMLAIIYSTHWGPWVFSDSVEYIVSARNLLAGNGLGYLAPSGDFVLYTLHPPLYPLFLSVLGLVGFDLVETARWLNILLFGTTIFLSGAFTYTLFHSTWLALSLSISLLTLPILVDVSSGAMSEPLFLFAGILAICLLILFFSQRKGYLLILSAISAGAAALSRYPGIAVVVACLTALLLAGNFSWKQRLRQILEFCTISLTPLTAWLIWIFYQSRTLAARAYPMPNDLWATTIDLRKKLMETFWSWLPYQEYLPTYSYNHARNFLIIFLVLFLLMISLVILKKYRFHASSHGSPLEFTFTLMWMIFALGNIVLLAVTYIFTNPVPDINTRTLLPVQFGLILVLLTLAGSVINEFHLPNFINLIVLGLVLIVSFPNAQTSWKMINQRHIFGAGYTSHVWQSNLTLQFLRNLPAAVPVISNQSAGLLFLANRPAYDLCSQPCDPSGQIRYGDDPTDPIQKIFREDGAALVFFYPACGVQYEQWYSSTLARLNLLTRDLRRAFSSCDGAIYFYPIAGQN